LRAAAHLLEQEDTVPNRRFILIFTTALVAAMLTVGGGVLLGGDSGASVLSRAVLAPLAVVLWLGFRLRDRWRK